MGTMFSKKRQKKRDNYWTAQLNDPNTDLQATIDALREKADKTIDVKGGKTTAEEAANIKDARTAIRAARKMLGKKNPDIVYKTGEVFGRTKKASKAGGPRPAHTATDYSRPQKDKAAYAATAKLGGTISAHGSIAEGKIVKTGSGPKPHTPDVRRAGAQATIKRTQAKKISDLGFTSTPVTKPTKPKTYKKPPKKYKGGGL
jgi:hypothetical protein